MNENVSKWQKKLKKWGLEAYLYLSSKIFLKNCASILAIGFAIILLIFLWLRLYTQHGQSITVDDYKGAILDDARRMAKIKNYRLQVVDSIHVVGKSGSTILEQNPKPNSKVKKNRTIYVTVAKYNPDLIKVANLPKMYGYEFINIKRQLEKRYQIKCDTSYRFDTGPSGHILEVSYEGENIISSDKILGDVQIKKGSTLHFVISNKKGAPVNLPDLVCEDFNTASFVLSSYGLKIGSLKAQGIISDTISSFIYRQEPVSGTRLRAGDKVTLYISSTKPASCSDE